MSKQKQKKLSSSLKIEEDGVDTFVCDGGSRIARRRRRGDRDRRPWIPLQKGWRVWNALGGIHVQFIEGPVMVL